jgi:hypothetical protein
MTGQRAPGTPFNTQIYANNMYKELFELSNKTSLTVNVIVKTRKGLKCNPEGAILGLFDNLLPNVYVT